MNTSLIDAITQTVSISAATRNKEAFNSILHNMTNALLAEREKILNDAFKTLTQLQVLLKQAMRPDIEAQYSSNGELLRNASFTKNTLDRQAKLQTAISNIESKIEDIIVYDHAFIVDYKDKVPTEELFTDKETILTHDKDVRTPDSENLINTRIAIIVDKNEYAIAETLNDLYESLFKLVTNSQNLLKS